MDTLKKFVLKNLKIVNLYENKNYKYVLANNGVVFALAKESSGCISCVFGTIEHFKKVKKYLWKELGMIEITKTTYTISNESVNYSCDKYELELYNINGEISHEVGCGYEVNIDPQSVAISITNMDGKDITEQVSDLEALKKSLLKI